MESSLEGLKQLYVWSEDRESPVKKEHWWRLRLWGVFLDQLSCSSQGMVGLKVWEGSSKTLLCALTRNLTADTLHVHPGELIGSVDSFEIEKDSVADDTPT